MRKHYPSDLSDDQWAILEPLIPPAEPAAMPGTWSGGRSQAKA